MKPCRKVDTGGIITTLAGTTSGFSGDGGPATMARLSFPFVAAVDGSGNLFIADQNNHRVRKVEGQVTDTDSDGVPDDVDNCPTVPNTGQEQTGNNVGGPFGDACVDPSVVIGVGVTIGFAPIIGEGAEIGDGTTIGANFEGGEFTNIGENVDIGNNVSFGEGTSVGDGSSLGDLVVVGENVNIRRDVIIGDRVTIGDGVTMEVFFTSNGSPSCSN